MDLKRLLDLVSQLSALRLFPSDPGGRVGIAKLMLAMCDCWEHAQWLVKRMLELYNEWPGPVEFRAVYCSRFKPQDGMEGYTTDPRFIEDGFPRDEPPPGPLLTAGEQQGFSRALLTDTAAKVQGVDRRKLLRKPEQRKP